MTFCDIHSRFSATTDESIDRHPLPDHGNRCKTNGGIIGMPIHSVQWWWWRWGRYSTSACVTLWAILSEFEISIDQYGRMKNMRKILDQLDQMSLHRWNSIFIFERVNSNNIFHLVSCRHVKYLIFRSFHLKIIQYNTDNLYFLKL